MTRDEALRLLYAYADGECTPDEADAVRAYAAGDASFAARIEAERRLRRAVAGAYAGEKAPASLRERVLAAVHAEQQPAAAASGGPRATESIRPRKLALWQRGLRGLAVAASVALVAGIAVWFVVQNEKLHRATVTAEVTDESPQAATFADSVEQVHLRCIQDAPGTHHHAGLPRHDLVQLAAVMSRDLHALVAAPDLTSLSMQFDGADYCKLMDHRGAHLIYRCPKGLRKPVSVFTVPALHAAENLQTVKGDGMTYAIVRAERTHTVAWTDGDVTYAACGECEPQNLVRVAEISHQETYRQAKHHGSRLLASH